MLNRSRSRTRDSGTCLIAPFSEVNRSHDRLIDLIIIELVWHNNNNNNKNNNNNNNNNSKNINNNSKNINNNSNDDKNDNK